jgi:hypothetical protein
VAEHIVRLKAAANAAKAAFLDLRFSMLNNKLRSLRPFNAACLGITCFVDDLAHIVKMKKEEHCAVSSLLCTARARPGRRALF